MGRARHRPAQQRPARRLPRDEGLLAPQRQKKQVIVEYALRDVKKPIGVSAYRLLERLPARLKGSPPTVEELEAELGRRREERAATKPKR